MNTTPEFQHDVVARFSASLPLRPDRERVRVALASAFVDHVADLWPAGEVDATPEWIRGNVDSMLAMLERIYNVAASGEHPAENVAEFLDRMGWLPELLANLDRPRLGAGAA